MMGDSRTGFLCLPGTEKHVPWEKGYPETCERVLVPFNRLVQLGLVARMKEQPSRSCTFDEMCLSHHASYVTKMEGLSKCTDEEVVDLCAKFESVNFSRQSFEQAKLVVGSTIDLCKRICSGLLRNGLALVRPPSHHSEEEMGANGYCLLNTTAIAVRSIQRNFDDVTKVLIFDWDVHHGQGTQSMFYDDPSVLYISIHRFEGGTFYPFLQEANYTYCGRGQGKGFNLNIPFNSSGLGDQEYMYAFMHLVLPVASEFNPDFVIISSGFDSADGDPKGQIKVTPGCYAHMTHHLLALAGGRMAVLLEGGYDPQVVARCVEAVSRVLLNDPLPDLTKLSTVDPRVIQQVQEIRMMHQRFWKCLENIQLNAANISAEMSVDEGEQTENENSEKDFLEDEPPPKDTAESMKYWRKYWHTYCLSQSKT